MGNLEKIKLDKEGFLINQELWDKSVAEFIAKQDGITLNEIHWIVIDFLRNFYQSYEIFPLVRQINKDVKEKTGNLKIGSIELYQAFPYGVLKQGAKFAGLSKPPNCI